MTLMRRASLRYLARHRSQCLLAISGIALGVAIVMGIQATQLAARAAFADALRGVFGQATHTIQATDGALPEALLGTVRRLVPAFNPTPVLDGNVRVEATHSAASLRLIGIEPVSAATTAQRTGFPLIRFMTEPGAAVLNRRTAQRLGVREGDTIELAGDTAPLQVIAIVDALPGAARLSDDVLLVDIATAQEVLASPARLSRIELIAADTASNASTLAALAAQLPAAVELTRGGRDTAGARELTRAFYTNLDALSLLALLVGAFMIYNTMAFLVVQRQGVFARLRSLGVTSRAIAFQVGEEALVLGSLGGLLGVLLGHALAVRLNAPLAQTLSDHYFADGMTTMPFSPGLAVAGVALAVLTTLAAALHPAWQAARMPPALALTRSAHESAAAVSHVWSTRLGWLAAVAAVVLLAVSAQSLLAGFAALGALIVAAVLLVPRLIAWLLGWIDHRLALYLPVPERLALKAGRRSLGRIGLAIAALMAATATSVGVGLMVGSFRTAVGDWLEQLLRADFYVAQEGADRAPPLIDEHLATLLAALPDVAVTSRVRRLEAAGTANRQRVVAYDLPAQARAGFRFIAGDPQTLWPAWSRGAAVVISEPYAWHHRLVIGDDVAIETPQGRLTLPVAGIYQDYGNERGVVAIAWQTYTRYWQDQRAHGVGIYVRDGADRTAVRPALEQATRALPALAVASNADLRARALAVFDRTFAITDVLTLFASVIAALGVFNALLAWHLERAREYAVMRATGCSRAELRRCLYAQTLWVALAAVVLAVPLGAAIALLLIEVINVRSFGWSMQLGFHAQAVVLPVLLAFGAALAATIYPAERALTIPPAAALRDE